MFARITRMASSWFGVLRLAAWRWFASATCQGTPIVEDQSLPPMQSSSANAATMIGRGLRLKCPACGKAPIFRGPFAMNDRCGACGRRFNRAPGYLLGSIYINYGLTALLVVVAYFSLYFTDTLRGTPLLVLLTAFSVIFPLWFFRYARALWIAFDERWDPWPNEEERRQEEAR
jgi:uncharacterized protein (DUF983 family)